MFHVSVAIPVRDDLRMPLQNRVTPLSELVADPARGLVYGSPLGVELADYGPGALDRVYEDLARAGRQYEGPNGFEAPMRAHIVTATK